MAPVSAQADVSRDERAVRQELAAAYRLVALFGWDDLLATHISGRVPGTDVILLNPLPVLFAEMRASELIPLDLNDDPPSGLGALNPAAVAIHTAVHRARPDIGCAIHLHAPSGVAVSVLAEGLLPLTQQAIVLNPELAYHDFRGGQWDAEELGALIGDLGSRHLLLLRNHGSLAVGPTVGAAFFLAYALEWACARQLEAMSAGRPLHWPTQRAIERCQGATPPARVLELGATLMWQALQRRLERESPGYAT